MKILIADDHGLVREGLRQSLTELDSALEVLEAADFQGAFDVIQNHADLSLALVDLNMPDMAGIQAINKIMDDAPTVPLVVLSASDNVDDMREVLDSGAMGFISKSESSAVIISALKLVLSGGVYVPPALINQPNKKPTEKTAAETNKPVLTPRQVEVLKLLANGESNKQIARDMGLSDVTIKVHLSAVFKALGVNNRTQAVLEASKCGLIE